MNEYIVSLIKNDYISQLRRMFPNSQMIRNTEKVQKCKILRNSQLGVGANADIENNKLEYGDYADECTLFHELDHIRKGTKVREYQVDAEPFLTAQNEVRYDTPRRGIFFDEATSEWLAITMFRNSPHFEPSIDMPKINQRSFYSNNLKILSAISNALNIPVSEFIEMIDSKHYEGNKRIDALFSMRSDNKISFSEIESALDDYETAHYIEYQCSLGNMEGATGLSNETKGRSQQSFKKALNKIENIARNRSPSICDVDNSI